CCHPKNPATFCAMTPQLEYFNLENDVTGPSSQNGQVVPDPNLYHLLNQVQHDAKSGTPTQFYLFWPKHKTVQRGPYPTQKQLLDSPTLRGKVPKGRKVL